MVVVVGTTVEGSAVVQCVPHDAKDVGLEAVLINAARSWLSSRRRTVDCGIGRLFAVIWDEQTK